jgi:glyoxylase-like metal-dependent hydrolase (beta-lactamase superfamily II)
VDGELAHGGSVTFGDCELAVRLAPGHAPGHVILVGDGVAIVGDVIFNGSIGRTDLPGGDLGTLMTSIREQVLTLPDETTLHTGHGADTTVGHERRTNPFVTGVYGGGGFA